MLKCFFKYSDIPEVIHVKEILHQKKQRLQKEDFCEPFREMQESEHLFSQIKQYAIDSNNEELANAQFVAHQYMLLFCQISSFFSLLDKHEYKSSWDTLQDCLDSAFWIGQYTIYENRFEVPQIIELLTSYECLYPYNVFASSEMIIIKSECSICGNAFHSPDCPHLKGNLYWGEIAVEKIMEIKEVQAIAMVSHPLNKRCVVEPVNEVRTDEEKFRKLNEFIKQPIYKFQLFHIEEEIIMRRHENLLTVGRNEKCPCGSGKKFKSCCGRFLYYEHLHIIIHPGERIVFQEN